MMQFTRQQRSYDVLKALEKEIYEFVITEKSGDLDSSRRKLEQVKRGT